MKINFNKLTKGVLIFSILLVAFSFLYYYIFFLPERERIAEKNLEICLLDADYAYLFTCWNNHCELLGREKNCKLPFERIDRCKEQRKEDKDYCFKKYPVK